MLAHGPTFMGNPLACAVANASLDLLRAGDWAGRGGRVAAGLRAGLEPLRGAPGVADVRVLGAIGVVQLDHEVDLPAGDRRRGRRRACGCGRSGTWSTPCRRT